MQPSTIMPPNTTTTTTTSSNNNNNNLKDPRFYRFEEPEQEQQRHPPQSVDYRPQNNGPLLSYIWCSGERVASSSPLPPKDDDAQQQQQQQQAHHHHSLTGQELYLGAEIGCDGKMYCIPGHALRVLQVDPATDQAVMIGPVLQVRACVVSVKRGVVCMMLCLFV